MSQPPLVLGLVSDIFFSAPIETTLKTLGYQIRWIERGETLAPGDFPAHQGAHLSEPLTGQSAAFIAHLTDWQPALILVELNSTVIPWAEWVAALKSSAATRRIPVVAFGPHTDLDLRTRALDVGCDVVIAKGRFLAALPELIQKYARIIDANALTIDCDKPLSARALHGITLFNQHNFFEAHEELEHAWNEDPGPARELYRGILQVAVAYLQIERRNYNGALKMFLRMRQWLDPLPEMCRGVNVVQLRAEALAARQALEALGPERLVEFNLALFKPIQLAEINPMSFQNKIALITGSGRGIGRALALHFAQAGADVVINFFRNRAPAEATAAAVRQLGRRALVVKADVGEPEGIEMLFAETEAAWGGLDILICNAASGYNRPVMEQKIKGWDWTMNINARAALFCAQRAAPLMEQRGGGYIVNLSSPGAQRVLPDYVVVGASKAALEAITRYLAVELAPKKIVVNAVSPGVVDTEALHHFAVARDSDIVERSVRATPAGRIVTPEDVAGLVAFLCSPVAEMIRGQTIVMDGGVTLTLNTSGL